MKITQDIQAVLDYFGEEPQNVAWLETATLLQIVDALMRVTGGTDAPLSDYEAVELADAAYYDICRQK